MGKEGSKRSARKAKSEEIAMLKELDAEAGDDATARAAAKLSAKPVIDNGATELFEKKLSKEEKKELAAKKKAEREARKAAAAGEAGSGDAEACAQAVPTTARAGKRAAETLADKVKREQALLDEELEAARIGAVRIRNAEGAFLGQLEAREFSMPNPGGGPDLLEKASYTLQRGGSYALVGRNGCGKSTLLKLMSGELSPTEGSVKKHQHCSLGLYHQHSTDVLDLDMAPLPFLRKVFPPSVVKHTEEWWRGYLATFGFSPEQQQSPMGMLSHGQRSRIVFAMLAMKDHTVLLLDEPTNHLDVDAVDGLAAAIKAFGGGVVLVSHDFRLIDQVADEIWLCEDRGVRRLEGSIHEYKKALAKKMSKHKVGLR
mmetsp:Transcript_45982/g.148111  ORF Transcript_45982/g.148111 Transcript_45982/m.148111 type:complete len:372 (+) Transcript_45982:140-1255(+)